MEAFLNNSDRIELLRKMIRIRCFEEKSTEYKLNGKLAGMVHCSSGQEAVDVGVCSALEKSDYILGNHRPHGYMIAKGADINLLMAEMFGKGIGTNGGKGGSMHLSDKSIGSLGSTGIVGSGLPVACGAAFASKYKNDGRVTCVFFGDGAANEGTFHECMNLASIWKLPMIFLLVNNCVAVTTVLEKVSVCLDLHKRAEPFGIEALQLDGQDVELVFNSVKAAVDYMRKDGGAVLIEARTHRFNEHAEGQAYARMAATGYRDEQDLKLLKSTRDPIQLYSKQLVNAGVLNNSDIERIYAEENRNIEAAVQFAEESPLPDMADAYSNIFANEKVEK